MGDLQSISMIYKCVRMKGFGDVVIKKTLIYSCKKVKSLDRILTSLILANRGVTSQVTSVGGTYDSDEG